MDLFSESSPGNAGSFHLLESSLSLSLSLPIRREKFSSPRREAIDESDGNRIRSLYGEFATAIYVFVIMKEQNGLKQTFSIVTLSLSLCGRTRRKKKKEREARRESSFRGRLMSLLHVRRERESWEGREKER